MVVVLIRTYPCQGNKQYHSATGDGPYPNCRSRSRPRACIVNRDADDLACRQTRPLEDRRLFRAPIMREVRRLRLLDRERYAEGMTTATAPWFRDLPIALTGRRAVEH